MTQRPAPRVQDARRIRTGESLRSPLEASPELRLQKLERARFIRRVVGTVVGAVLLVCGAWAGWGLWSVRQVTLSGQGPMRADRAAGQRLDGAHSDLTLVVVKGLSRAPGPRVVVVREPEGGGGSWALALSDADLPTGEGTQDSVAALLSQGRATLIKQVEGLIGSTVGHYIEVDAVRVFTVAAGDASDASGDLAAALLSRASSSPSSTVSALCDVAARYRAARNRRLGFLGLPALAHAMKGAVTSDMAATQLDGFFQRLGADTGQERLRYVVAPVEAAESASEATTPVISASAARVLGGQMLSGKAFSIAATKAKQVVPASVTVNVLNGAGRDGVAGQAARILKRDGYDVKDVGNANQFVYDKTLVVYKTDQAPAEAVSRALGIGTVVASRGMYSFATDVLVVVGADWPKAP